jgi:predicted permease
MSLYKKSFLNGIARVFSLPRLSIPLILTLGLTLGAVLSVISISSTLFYQPLQGVKNEASLQTFEYRFNMSETLSVSYWNMHRLAAISEQFSDLGQWAAISNNDQDVKIDDVVYPTTSLTASNNILDVLGTRLLLGDDVTMDDPNKYIWISESLWNYAYSGTKSVVGKQMSINNKIYIVAGVIEDVMAIKSQNIVLPQQVWFIKNLVEVQTKPDQLGNINNAIDFLLLKSPGNKAILPTKAQTDEWLVNYVTKNVEGDNLQQFLDFLTSANKAVISNNYRDNMLGESADLLIALFFAVIGLLLMASLNLLNLFIAHYQGRTKEFAIQLSLGASLLKIRLMVLLENLPSFVLAAITGLLVTGWVIKSLPMLAGESLPMMEEITINTTTIIASLMMILLLSVIFSAFALVDINKAALNDNLNSSGKGLQAQSNQWLSRLLMVFQLSIASILLTASVMVTLQSYHAVYQDLGYDIGNSYNITMVTDDEEYIEKLRDDRPYQTSEIKTLLTKVSDFIESKVVDSEVIITSTGPLSESLLVNVFQNEGEERIVHQMRNLSANFFEVFNIEILAGANLTQAQIDNNEDRIVIDASMAKTVFPELSYQEVIGKTIQLISPDDEPAQIVTGIVADTISQTGMPDGLALPAIYSHRIALNGGLQFTVMMPEGKSINTESLNTELSRQFPRLTNLQVTPLSEIWDRQTLNQRASLTVVLSMTALTLLLAAIGVAGLTQMTTNHRKYELAVRMATGAKQLRLVNFILKDALWMLVLGLGIGFVVSVLGYQQLEQQLEMLPSFNWLAMSLLDLGLIVIVMLSVFVPAWRVINADPMQALRAE